MNCHNITHTHTHTLHIQVCPRCWHRNHADGRDLDPKHLFTLLSEVQLFTPSYIAEGSGESSNPVYVLQDVNSLGIPYIKQPNNMFFEDGIGSQRMIISSAPVCCRCVWAADVFKVSKCVTLGWNLCYLCIISSS